MNKERILIPGKEKSEPLGLDQILVFDNHGDERRVITLTEAKEKDVKAGEISERISKLSVIALALKDLPINSLSYEANPATCEVGWHAPKGYSFKIEGKFYINQTASIKEGWESYVPPTPSKSQFIEEHKDKFSSFLIEAKGDEKLALRLLIEDVEDWEGEGSVDFLPINFIGKWLFIESAEGKPISLQDISKGIKFKIATDAEVRENDEFFEELRVKLDGENAITRTAFPSNGKIDFVQAHAEAIPSECQITLIKRREKKLGLLVAKPRLISIVKPLWSNVEPLEPQEKLKPGDVRF